MVLPTVRFPESDLDVPKRELVEVLVAFDCVEASKGLTSQMFGDCGGGVQLLPGNPRARMYPHFSAGTFTCMDRSDRAREVVFTTSRWMEEFSSELTYMREER